MMLNRWLIVDVIIHVVKVPEDTYIHIIEVGDGSSVADVII